MRQRCFFSATAVMLGIAVGHLPLLARTYVVQMTDRPPYLQPQVVEVKVGDTVIWKNRGPQLVHTVIDDELRLFSDDIAVGGDWAHTFGHAGTYPYLCLRHFFMRGTIVVRNPDGSLESSPDFPYQKAFKEFVVPTLNAVPRMITVSRFDNIVWFTEGGGEFYGFEDIPAQNKLGRIDEQGHIVEYATPSANPYGTKVGVDSVVMDHSGRVWFTERVSNRVGYIDREEVIHEFPLPTKNGEVLGIDVDGMDQIWFAERFGNRIGWVTLQGWITEIEMPEKDSEPRTVFVDSRDRIWYTARAANEIGYYDKKTGKFNRVQLPTEKARPAGICEASNGTIYFAEMVANKIGKIVGSQVVEYPTPTKFSAPFKCVADQQDNIWFTEIFGNSVGELNTETGEVQEYRIPTPDSRPGGIAIDHKGRVWFTEQKGNKIGMFDPTAAGVAENNRRTPKLLADAGKSSDLIQSGDGLVARVKNFQLPTLGAGPGSDLVEDENGWLWFPEIYGNKLGAIHSISKEFREIEMPTPVSMPVGVARTADGTLWVTEFRGNRLAMVDPRTGSVREFLLPTPSAFPAGIAVDEQDQLWLAQLAANRIARFDPDSQRFEEYALPQRGSGPLQIAADKRGALWVAASKEAGNYLARFDLRTKRFEMFKVPTAASGPAGLLIDDDTVWVTESQAGKLAKFNIAARAWEEFPIPVERSEPARLAKDVKGRLWVTDGGGLGTAGGNSLALFDPVQRAFSVLPIKTRQAKPAGILAATDGHIWFTQMGANCVSRISLEVESRGSL